MKTLSVGINVNDNVWIRLTPEAVGWYLAYYEKYLPPDLMDGVRERAPKAGEWWKVQLWTVMQILGPHITMHGGAGIIENEIMLTDPAAE